MPRLPKPESPRTASPRTSSSRTARASHEVRIIGGIWKRTRLSVVDKPGLRPTPDRVRETLFNWLGQDLGGWRCIDVFAGTGVLGFEAASRGAREVLVIEQDAELVDRLRATQARLSASAVRVERGNGLTVLARLAPGAMDAIFLDPPFDAGLYDKALAACAPVLSPEGFVYLEAPEKWTDERLAPFHLAVYRHMKAGAVHAHLLSHLAPAGS